MMEDQVSRTYEGRPCKHGHGTTRYISKKSCVICERTRSLEWGKKNPEKKSVNAKRWHAENRDKVRARQKIWHAENRDKVLTRQKFYYEANANYMILRVKKWREENSQNVNERRRNSRLENPEKIRSYERKYRLEHPEKIREIKCKYSLQNCEKILERQREYRLEHPEKIREQRQKYYKENRQKFREAKHKRRALMKNAPGTFTRTDLRLIADIQNGICAYCAETENLHLDHITPLSRGGSNWPWNLQWLCAHHNLSKYNKTDAEYRRLIGLPPVIPVSVKLFLLPLIV